MLEMKDVLNGIGVVGLVMVAVFTLGYSVDISADKINKATEICTEANSKVKSLDRFCVTCENGGEFKLSAKGG